MMDPYVARHYAGRLRKALEAVEDIYYELSTVLGHDDIVDDDELHLTLNRLDQAAKGD